MSAMHQFARWGDGSQRRTALRSLYREVAKRVHPDLTSDEADRSRRQILMAEANQAFEHGDANRLTKILAESESRSEPVQGTAVAADLVRAVRKITLKARLHLTFLERFDNDRMKCARSLLAENLLATAPLEKIHEDVMDFFEEMHMFLHDCYLDEELMWSTFGFSAVRWWAVCKNYVSEERNRKNDQTFFGGFQDLAFRFSKRDEEAGFREPTIADLFVFLEAERKRTLTGNGNRFAGPRQNGGPSFSRRKYE